MASSNADGDLVPGLARLPWFERTFAIRTYGRLAEAFRVRGNTDESIVRAKALNLTYVALGRRWLLLAAAVALPGAICWSFRDTVWELVVAIGCSVILAISSSFTALRAHQAVKFWPDRQLTIDK